MHRTLLATALLVGTTGAAVAQTAPAAAQTGYSAGDFVVRLAASYISPLTPSSHIDVIGGKVDVTDGAQPEVDISYFVTDHISVQLIATATRHEISAKNTALAGAPYNLGSKLDLASTYVLPPAITAQYHFFPHSVFSPYVGLGIDFLFPFDTQENTATLGGTQIVQKVGLSNAVGPVLDIGLDYNVSGPWFFNVDYKQIFNQVTARVHTALGLVKARVALDPSVFSVGIAYRF
ncbi:MAG: OmpW family outer membrane protein [Rhodospirillales bacterium]